MSRFAATLAALFVLAAAGAGADEIADALASITPEEFLERVKFLSSDELEGRDSGSEGERRAREYIAAEFERLGLEPAGDDGTWFQAFPVDDLTGHNVVARLPGADPGLSGEYIVIGGHYDHVGYGRYGSTWGARGAGKIHNGADDNASGTAAVLEIAEAFAGSGLRPRRSILFILFSGEERGLVGSEYYVEHPTVVRGKIAAMVNLDMVGRGTGVGNFLVNGTRTSPTFPDLVAAIEADLGHRVEELPFGFAPSDNTSFYQRSIPVLYLTTGTHPEYHNPDDDWTLINEDNGAAVARFAFELVRRLADADDRPAFQWAELQPRSYLDGLRWLVENQLAAGRPYLGLTLGQGLEVESVVSGSAAERAGLEPGDVLVRLDGVDLGGRADLTRALRGRRPGQTVRLVVRRSGEEQTLEAVLGRR